MLQWNLSRITTFAETHSSTPYWIGVDVHKRSYHVALHRSDGEHLTWVTSAEPQTFANQLLSIPVTIRGVAYESGPTGFGLARTLNQAGIPVIIAAPSRVPRAVRPGAKSDRLDCIKLAEYASRGMLRSIAIPNEDDEALRALLRRRHQLAKSLRRAKQRIKSFLLLFGIPEPTGLDHWSIRSQKSLTELQLGPAHKSTLASLIRQMKYVEEEQKIVLAQLKSYITESGLGDQVHFLTSIPGVGPITALTFQLEIFNPGRFNRAEELTGYLGLAPMVHHSGEKTPSGRLQAVGQKCLRSLLVEAAWIWKTRDEGARLLYNRLLAKSGIPQKAICAVARRLAIILWRIAVEKRPYYPVHQPI